MRPRRQPSSGGIMHAGSAAKRRAVPVVAARAALAAFGILVLGAPARAENLDAGKSPAALFASNCSACHRSPKGLAKDSSPRAIADFLRQHYTTGPETAAQLAAYLAGAGADPQRTKQGREAERPGRPGGERRSRPAEAGAPPHDDRFP